MTRPRSNRAVLMFLLFALACFAGPSVRHARAEDILRLPTEIRPTYQEIRLELDPRKMDYSGSTRTELKIASEVQAIHFHAQQMTLTRVVLQSKKAARTLQAKEGNDGLVRAEDGKPIAPGEYTLSIDFTNDYDKRATSLYRLETGGESYCFTQFEAIDARMAFPCFDEPSFKFPYRMVLSVPEKDQAVSNTPIERTTTRNGVKTVTFRKTKPLPSYLLCVATGPLEYVPMWGLSVPGRIVVPKGSKALAETAAKMTPPILKAVERYFGSPYPYEKLDLIAVPEFSPGAMENPGAITYGDRFILFDPKTMSIGQKRLYAVFTAHELAHMWFGDLVTMKWWDDLWLNESFAEWMGDKIAAQVYPELDIELGRGLQGLQTAMVMDARLTTRAIRQPIQSMSNLFQNVDALTYQKGQAILNMFERFVGPETFRKGILAYLNKYKWGNAEAKDLWSHLSEAAGVDLQAPMASFLDQSGIPVVRAEILDGGTVRLSQRRFLNYGVTTPDDPLWQIPVTLLYPDGDSTRTYSVLLKEGSATVTLPGVAGKKLEWVHPNAKNGYYRWSVAGPSLHALAAAAPKVLDRAQRIGFVQNLTALLNAGEVHGDDYVSLLEKFGADEDPNVVSTLTGPLSTIQTTFVDEGMEDAFATYVRRVLGPAAQRFGLDRAPGEAPAVSVVRPQLLSWLADEGKDEKALAHAEHLASMFLTDRGSIDPSLVGTALRLSALRGDAARFADYQKRFEAATAPTDRDPFLAALGSFRDPALREKALAYALSDQVRPHEVFEIPQAMGANPAYQMQLFEWAMAHYKEIIAKIPPVYAVFVPYFGAGCDAPKLAKAKEFFSQPEHSVAGAEVELARMLEAGNDCIGLKAREGEAVKRYLTQVAEAK